MGTVPGRPGGLRVSAGYLADAEARGLAPATIQKLEHVFKVSVLISPLDLPS